LVKVAGLTVGRDDHVTKPFSLEEVVARIRAVLRRTHGGSETAVDSSLVVGDLRLDEDSHEVYRGDVSIELSPTEFKLLRYLMLNAGRVVSKTQILDHVWDYDWSGAGGIVESYISYLRRKIDVVGDPMIHTKRGSGYVLRAAERSRPWALPAPRTQRPVALWTRIVALISLLLVVGTVVTGCLSLFLLNRTLIQSVDDNLKSSTSEMLTLAQYELAGDDDAVQ